MRYNPGGKMTDQPPIELKIHLSTENPTDEELKAAVLAAVNSKEFVDKLRHAHASSKTVQVLTEREFDG
jgi:hypothetical protein